MATHPIDLSNRVIDSGVVDERLNRVEGDIWELTDNVAIVESFSHCVTGFVNHLASFARKTVRTRRIGIHHIAVWLHGGMCFRAQRRRGGMVEIHVLARRDRCRCHWLQATDVP